VLVTTTARATTAKTRAIRAAGGIPGRPGIRGPVVLEMAAVRRGTGGSWRGRPEDGGRGRTWLGRSRREVIGALSHGGLPDRRVRPAARPRVLRPWRSGVRWGRARTFRTCARVRAGVEQRKHRGGERHRACPPACRRPPSRKRPGAGRGLGDDAPVIGIGAGTRPTARLSPIVTGGAQAVGPGHHVRWRRRSPAGGPAVDAAASPAPDASRHRPGAVAPGGPSDRPAGSDRGGAERRGVHGTGRCGPGHRPRWRGSVRLRDAEPSPERLPPLLHDRRARGDSHPGAAPAEGARTPGDERLALPAPRRGPPGAGLHQRRLPVGALQPVRLYEDDLSRYAARPAEAESRSRAGRPATFGEAIGAPPGARSLRDPPRPLPHARAPAGPRSPERQVRGALIGGTNGKGSVVALVSSCLAAAGLRAGDTPKPHLVTYRERLRISGRPIGAADFTALVGDVLPLADAVARRHGPPAEFELMTALAFAWFGRQAIDLAIVEVGLGGRLDATHAWDGGVAAITNVDLDHTSGSVRRSPRSRARRRRSSVSGPRGERGRRRGGGGDPEARPAGGSHARRAAPGPRVAMDRAGLLVDPRVGTTGSACWAATRRPTSPSPTPCSMRSPRRGSRPSRPPRGGWAMRPLAVRDAWSSSTCPVPAPAGPLPRSSSTGPTTRPGRPRWWPRSTSCGLC